MKGICFIEPLHGKTVKKIKTETRRIIVNQPLENEIIKPFANGLFGIYHKVGGIDNLKVTLKPRYKVGDVLYLKEPYRFPPDVDFIVYKFDYPNGRYEYPGCDKIDTNVDWKNKLFMPASAARHFIKITDVRAERLQDISGYDCIKEGIEHTFPKATSMTQAKIDYDSAEPGLRKDYATLIDKINGKGTWDNNPWVWVYDYELIDRKEVLI